MYSSAVVAYVPVSDVTYQMWLAQHGTPTRIAAEQDLWDVLTAAGVPIPVTAGTSDAQKNVSFDQIPLAVKVWAFAIENRVRVLEGQPTRTVAQFKNYVKSILP